MSFGESLNKLRLITGEKNYKKIFTDEEILSPVHNEKNSDWLKKSKIVGVNVRLLGTFWNAVKYLMTTPANAVHFLPFFETGCEGSVYSPVNWEITSEFLDENLSLMGYTTPLSQLKLMVKALHAAGKTVGFDFVMHTDKFSEINFVYPDFFEWVKLDENKTREIFYPDVIPNELHIEAEKKIIEYLKIKGDFYGNATDNFTLDNFYNNDKVTPDKRYEILFGKNEPHNLRTKRRIELLNYLRKSGFELTSVTEYSPSRPVLFGNIRHDEEKKSDHAEFYVPNMSKNAVIFNCLTPYKWYVLDNDKYPIKNKVNEEVWNYYINKADNLQKTFNFDFIRADMGHNQISHSHKDENKDMAPRELWAELKDKIQVHSPYFALFGEHFLVQEEYIDVFQDIKNKKFDVVLGCLQHKFLNEEFINTLFEYKNIKEPFSVCATAFASDTDSPLYKKLYESPLSNEVRYFVSMFSGFPSYIGMGIETREPSAELINEYTGNFVLQINKEYKWGENYDFLKKIQKLRDIYLQIYPEIKELAPEFIGTKTGNAIGFLYKKNETPLYFFLIDLTMDTTAKPLSFFNLPLEYKLNPIFSNIKSLSELNKTEVKFSTEFSNTETGEVRIYKFEKINKKNTKNNDEILIVLNDNSLPFDFNKDMELNFGFINEFKKLYPNKKIKIILPSFINPDKTNKKNKKFNINTGLIKTKVFLYEDTYGETGVYSIYFNEMNDENIPEYIKTVIFNQAVYKILPKMKKSFNPKIIQTTGFKTAYLNFLIKTSKEKFYKEINTIHSVCDVSDKKGSVSPLKFLLTCGKKDEIKEILSNKKIQSYMKELRLKNNITDNDKLFADVLFDEEYLNEKNKNLTDKINSLITLLMENTYGNIYDVKNDILECKINLTKMCIEKTDFFYANSISYFNEITGKTDYSSSRELSFIFDKYKEKGCGILPLIDCEKYDTLDENKLFFPYEHNNYRYGKMKNKEFLLTCYLKGQNLDDVPFIQNPHCSFKYAGALDFDLKAPLIFAYLEEDKSSSLYFLFEAIKILAEENWNFRLIVAGKNISKISDNVPDKFTMLMTTDKRYLNKIVIIDNPVFCNQYLASSDIFLSFPKNEPYGMLSQIAMKFGCIPVVSNTGAYRDFIVSALDDYNSANGIKTKDDLRSSKNPEILIANAIKEAIREYYDDKNLFNKMIENGMKFNINKSQAEKFYNLYDKLL